ncbi:MAG: hypothetical protein ACJ77E_00860 [Gaiellaceae bacterium]
MTTAHDVSRGAGGRLFPGAPNPPLQLQALRRQATQGRRDVVARFR